MSQDKAYTLGVTDRGVDASHLPSPPYRSVTGDPSPSGQVGSIDTTAASLFFGPTDAPGAHSTSKPMIQGGIPVLTYNPSYLHRSESFSTGIHSEDLELGL